MLAWGILFPRSFPAPWTCRKMNGANSNCSEPWRVTWSGPRHPNATVVSTASQIQRSSLILHPSELHTDSTPRDFFQLRDRNQFFSNKSINARAGTLASLKAARPHAKRILVKTMALQKATYGIHVWGGRMSAPLVARVDQAWSRAARMIGDHPKDTPVSTASHQIQGPSLVLHSSEFRTDSNPRDFLQLRDRDQTCLGQVH